MNVVQEKEARYSDLRSVTVSNKQDIKDFETNHTSRNPYDDIIIEIFCSNDDKRAYILIDHVELQRVISNLVENSIESIKTQAEGASGFGKISIYIIINETHLRIEIIDNGKGIPEDLLDEVKQKGFSFGKENGEGLGLYSSIKKVENWGGTLHIDSKYESGTTVTIKLPKIVKPEWASSEINLEGIENIVILDDDYSIHHIWADKLKTRTPIPIFNFTTTQRFKTQLHRFKEKTLFLLDYELRGERETGLDMAHEVIDKKNCHIVTHNFQDPTLQRECKRLGGRSFSEDDFVDERFSMSF